MTSRIKLFALSFVVLVIVGIILFLFYNFVQIPYLSFSDAAKSADIARNIISGLGYNGNFSFWGSSIVDLLQRAVFPSPWLPPLMPFSIVLAFKIFGVSDMAVIGVSLFYFVLLVIFTFLLGKKLAGNLVGALSAITIATSIDFLNYATNGSTEALFTFEIVASAYLLSIRKKWAVGVAVIFAALMYFTRPQAFIYIAGLLLYSLLINFKVKKVVMVFGTLLIIGFLVDYFILPNFAGKYFLYSVTGRGVGTATQVAAGGSASDSLRGVSSVTALNLLGVGKKVFYNLYNFYKLMPQIINPYLFAFFVIGLFFWNKNKVVNSFKISSIFMIATTFLVGAASIPFFRYIHPIVPLIYIVAVAAMVEIFSLKITSRKFIVFASTCLIVVFAVGQTLGVIFLDSRFIRNTHNVDKPPTYVTLSKILKENTQPRDFVVTNLDTWGSWYGERRTIWFPVDPVLLIDSETGEIPFDAIYLTSYLMDDQNYYMGDSWRLIFNNPTDSKKWTCDGCSEIAKEFKLKSIYSINQSDNYERQAAKAILLIKK